MKNLILFFIISPFLGFIQGLKNYRESWAKNTVWLFVIFYGFTMAKPEIADSSRYVTQLKTLHNSEASWNTFVNTLYEVDDRGSGNVDIYQQIVTYVVSLITSNGDVLFAIFGAVFGFFYSRNIWFLLQSVRKDTLSWTSWMILISFMCAVGFWNLGGVRMWTAAHVFFYGAFLYLLEGKKKGLIFCLLSVFVHFSFVLPLGLFLFYILVKPSYKILFYIFLVSFFISSLKLTFINATIEAYAPDFIIPRVSNYASEDYAEVINDMNEKANWYIVYYNQALNWGLMLVFSIVFFKRKIATTLNESSIKFFGLSLFLLIVGNFLSGVTSGGRYLTIAQLFATASLLLITINYKDSWFRRKLILCAPFFIFFVIISVRVAIDTVTFDTIFFNPIIAVFANVRIPLIDFIK